MGFFVGDDGAGLVELGCGGGEVIGELEAWRDDGDAGVEGFSVDLFMGLQESSVSELAGRRCCRPNREARQRR